MPEFKQLFPLFTLLALLLALLIVGVGGQAEREPEAFPNRSIYNSQASGIRAWYLVNRRAGLPLSLWQKSFNEIGSLPTPVAMVMVSPLSVFDNVVTFGPDEADTMLAWVAGGNTLILLDDFQRMGSAAMLARLYPAIRLERLPAAEVQAAPLLHVSEDGANSLLKSYVAEPLTSATPYRLIGDRRSEVLLADARGRALLIRRSFGRGHLILGTPIDLLGNPMLYGAPNDNFQFFANLLTLEQKPVFVNEFVHGHGEADNLFDYLQASSPLGRMAMQLIFGFLFLLWLGFLRWRPQRDTLGRPEHNPPGEMTRWVSSLAALAQRTHSTSIALAPLVRRIEATLAARYRLSADETPRLADLLGGLSWGYAGEEHERDAGPPVLLKALERAQEVLRRQERLSDGELLMLSRRLNRLQTLLETIHDGSRIARRDEPGRITR